MQLTVFVYVGRCVRLADGCHACAQVGRLAAKYRDAFRRRTRFTRLQHRLQEVCLFVLDSARVRAPPTHTNTRCLCAGTHTRVHRAQVAV